MSTLFVPTPIPPTLTDKWSIETQSQIQRARAYCEIAVTTYWLTQRRRVGTDRVIRPSPLKNTELSTSDERTAETTGERAARLPVTEAAYELSSLYASMLPPSFRSQHGVFYTPPVLAERLLDMVTEAGMDWTKGRILDPACGGGAFVAPVTARILQALNGASMSPRERIQNVVSRVRGIELDAFSAWMAQVFFEVAILDFTARCDIAVPRVIAHSDALESAASTSASSFHLVVGNPPYGRITLPPQLRSRFAPTLYGHANLYGMFTQLAVEITQKNGFIAFVTPTSFLGGQYFTNLRRYLLRESPPLAIDFVSDRKGVFDNVLQETALIVLRRNHAPRRVQVHSITPTSAKAPCQVSKIASIAHSGRDGTPWLLPREVFQVPILRRASLMSSRLSDFGYTASTGPLVWNRHKSQLSSNRIKNSLPLIWAESVTGLGTFEFKYDKRNHSPFFHILPGQDHLVLRTPCVLVQRTTAKEQHRRLVTAVLPERFIAQHGGVVVENHLNILRPSHPEPAVRLEVVSALLNSKLIDDLFRCISGSVAVSAFELESLPLPTPEALKPLESIMASRHDDHVIEAFIRSAYGV